MYTALHVHSGFSMLDGISQPSAIAKRCKNLGLSACALTDHGNICGAIKFTEAMKKQGLKPILGCELYICEHHSSIQTDQNKDLLHLVVLAKNIAGYKDLLKIISRSNSPDSFHYKPRLSLPELKELNSGNLIGFSGHLGSHMSHSMFGNMKAAAKLKEEKYIREEFRENVVATMEKMALTLLDIFGQPNFFLEVQLIDRENLPINNVIASGLRYLSKKLNIPCIATPDAHYCEKKDADNQRILLCNAFNMTMTEVYEKIKSGQDTPLTSFFNSSNYHIPSYQEMVDCGHTSEELENTLKITEMCEDYDITKPPSIPKFKKTNNLDPVEYLKREIGFGFQKKKDRIERVCQNKGITVEDYRQRYKYEQGIILDAGLEHYFLLVQDIVKFAKSQGIMVGYGRGCVSSATKVIIDDFCSKNINKLKIGDRVLTSDGTFQNIIDTHKYKINEPTLNIKCYYGDQLGVTLTLDHKVLVEKHIKTPQWERRNKKSRKKTKVCQKPKGKPEWIEAKDISVNDWVYFPLPKREMKQEKYIDLYEYCKNDKDIILLDNVIQYWCNNKLCNTKKLHSSTNRYLKTTKKLYKIIGIFAGDGWFSKNKNNSIGFAFNKSDIENISMVKDYFEKLGCNVTITPHKTTHLIQLYVYNRIIYHLFRKLFDKYQYTSLTKHVPDIIFTSKLCYIKSFLSGYRDADGHTSKDNRTTYSTISRSLVDQIRILHLYLKQPSSVSKYIRHDKRNEYKNAKPSYSIHVTNKNNNQRHYFFTKNGVFLKVRKILKKYTTKYVYDISVENNKNYVTPSFTIHNSAAGCLISYLLDITDVDPLEYDLLFERFYNSSRKGSLPDIDIDFEAHRRGEIFDYLKKEYGEKYFARICTFGTINAKAALKEVLRNDGIGFELANEMTKNLVDQAKISDQLQEIWDETGDDSYTALDWNIDHDIVKQYCYRDENGNLCGEYAEQFQKAIEIAGVYKSTGVHACGCVISELPIEEVAPLVRAKDGALVIGYAKDCEKVGLTKVDILSLTTLDSMNIILQLINKDDKNETNQNSS